MNKKDLHPILQVLLTLLFVSFLVISLISFGIIYFPEGDFDEIINKYKLELQFVFIISSLSSMSFIYYSLRYRVRRRILKLKENSPIVHWSYERLYWENFKTKEYQKKAIIYGLKILSIWLPIGVFLYLLNRLAPPMVSDILIFLILILTIPIIPFTLGSFISDVKNQLFQVNYVVNIYEKGLTINDVYYPYNQHANSDCNLRLHDIEKLVLYNTNCLKFILIKMFYSPPTHDGGDSGSVIRRKINILIPIPENQDVDLNILKKQLNVKTRCNFRA